MTMGLYLSFAKADMYIEKEETIQKWMTRDEQIDEFVASKQPPSNINCRNCGDEMVCDMRDYYDLHDQERVLFFLFCSSGCKPGRGIFDNGDEFTVEPTLCPKCNVEVIEKVRRTKKAIIRYYNCPRCEYRDKDITDLSDKPPIEEDPEYINDRARFCLSIEEGEKWRHYKVKFAGMKDLVDSFKEKEKNKHLYDQLKRLEKVSVAQLESLLKAELKEGGYQRLEFLQPEIQRHVVVSFTAQDTKGDRSDAASKYDLQRLVKGKLENTNWRLMSDGITSRLGVLTGRLKGFESEADLLELIKKRKK